MDPRRVTELHFEGWSDEIADRCLDAWRDLPRKATGEHRTLAIRLLFLQTSRSAYANAWTAARKLLPQALASGNVADCVLLLLLARRRGAAPRTLGRCARSAAKRERPSAIGPAATRHAVIMRLLQAWIALEEQRFEDALRLSLAERAQAEAQNWTNAQQMSLLSAGASALALGRIAEAADDLERLRDWYAPRARADGLVLGSTPAYAISPSCPCGAAISSARRSKRRRRVKQPSPRPRGRGAAALTSCRRSSRSNAHAFDEAGQYLRQARREVRGISAPLVAWRIEAVTATLLEKTAQPDSARRARQKYERALERLRPQVAAWRASSGSESAPDALSLSPAPSPPIRGRPLPPGS